MLTLRLTRTPIAPASGAPVVIGPSRLRRRSAAVFDARHTAVRERMPAIRARAAICCRSRLAIPRPCQLSATATATSADHAVSQVAQTSLRSVIGQNDLDQLLSGREKINAHLKDVIDAPTEEPWGILVERVELKDISLPESMKRSMSRQAEAERERRARVIAADGEYQASTRLAEAATVMAADPAALQLRLLQTVVEVAGEKNSTLVMPVPVELLRFFEKMTPGSSGAPADSGALEEPEDTGDAEVAQAEAAIAHTSTPALGQAEMPPVPEVAPVAENAPELPAGDGAGQGESLPSAEVPATGR